MKRQYEKTIGRNNHKTADLCHKVAQNCMRKGQYTNARELIDRGLRTWRLRDPFFMPELARTTFLKTILEELCGHEREVSRLAEEARGIRNEIPQVTRKTEGETLTWEDFDEIVSCFSR